MFDQAAKQQIAREWRSFSQSGSADGSVVRDFILASWKRSRAHGVDPIMAENCSVDGGRLNTILQQRKVLLRISMPVIENLYSFIEGSRSVIILTDENGIILNCTGDQEYLQNAKGYCPGIEYTEKTIGTNGIGTALYLDQPVQIWAEEHFAQRNHELSCSAAPIHDPHGEIIGCLNLSCLWNKVHTHTLGMVKAAASSIEQQLRIESVLENKVALLQEKEGIFELFHDGLLTIDKELIITDINEEARRIIGIAPDKGVGSSVKQHILSGIDFHEIIRGGKILHDQEATLKLAGGVLGCSYSATPVAKSEGLIITLKEAKSVRRMVNRYAGSKAVYTFDDIIGASPQLMESIRLAKIAGQSDTNTLILGESGTGKEMFAQAIHNTGDRCKGPFVAINCGALPRDLIQSELFGYAEGAFTGARRQGNPGKFELADGGTIFLDEIGEMPLAAQVNLLRVVENKEVMRVGDKYARPVDVRIIAASNRQLVQTITEKNFREDLYYRLNVLTINLPPLRLRQGDLRVLLEYFLEKISSLSGKQKPDLSEDALETIIEYKWPGNIRELENCIERAVHICQANVITKADLSREIRMHSSSPLEVVSTSGKKSLLDTPGETLRKPLLSEREHASIIEVLQDNRGNIRRSAEKLGIARSTLYEKIKRFNIDVSQIR